jgi:hypothetical protein
MPGVPHREYRSLFIKTSTQTSGFETELIKYSFDGIDRTQLRTRGMQFVKQSLPSRLRICKYIRDLILTNYFIYNSIPSINQRRVQIFNQ